MCLVKHPPSDILERNFFKTKALIDLLITPKDSLESVEQSLVVSVKFFNEKYVVFASKRNAFKQLCRSEVRQK